MMGRPQIPLTDRMWKYIVVDEKDCWLWNGSVRPNGYGQTKVAGIVVSAHRAVYELLVGEIPRDRQLDHLCLNKICVNPAHLEPVTASENQQRRVALITHCPSGHPREGNWHITPGGAGYCAPCRILYQRRYRLAAI